MTINMFSEDHKLFQVDFGKPTLGSGWSYPGVPSVIVIAKSYEEAAKKGLEYAVDRDAEPILDRNGDLINKEPIEVSAVKLVQTKLVF